MQHSYLAPRRRAATRLLACIWVPLALLAAPVCAQDANVGRVLYNTPFVAGQLSCSAGACHTADPLNRQNRIQNGDTPGGIAFAISTIVQMSFLRGQVNATQLGDLAAYIADPASATGGPVAQVTPSTLTFTPTQVGDSSATQPVTVSNTGTAPMTVSAIGVDNAEFVVAGSCTSIAANSDCALTVHFVPAATGTRSGTLTVSHNAPGGTSLVSMTGTGTAPVAQVAPAALTFAATSIGSMSGAQQFALTNTGTAPLNISAITSNRAEFPLLGGTCAAGGTVAVAASCSVMLRFVPAVAGERSGLVTVNHNAAGGSSVVSVAGTGVGLPFEKHTMVEYIYTPLNYYFITSRDSDKAALDMVAAFQRTGQSFAVYAAPEAGTQGISRFYFDKVALNGSRGSHFYTLVDSEKMLLAALNPGNATLPKLPFNEGIDSYAFLPAVEGVGGSCAPGQVPVYRLFRGNLKFPDDPNHRFTISTAIYNEFVALGWDGEGVKFCTPTP